MRFPVQELRPAGGELYAHVFENPSVGVSRNLFWNLRVEFAPVELDGEERDCSLACEWLVWPIRRWTDLSGLGIADVLHPEQVETSFYLAEHSPARLHELRVTRVH